MRFSVITPEYHQLEMLKMIKEHYDAQTFKDFEWIVSSDGEDQTVSDWCNQHHIRHVWHPKEKRDYSKTVNDAAKVALGEYMIVINADSYPAPDLLEKLDKIVSPGRVITTTRVQVDGQKNEIGKDWRLDRNLFDDEVSDFIPIYHTQPWASMTGNGMVWLTSDYLKLGGMWEEYEGGREDWDIFAQAYFRGWEMMWAPRCLIYHFYHGEWTDSEHNLAVWEKRMAEMREKYQK